ncbi:hypothetical protein SAMN05192559_1044 [Halobacillus karajensis]|nr:hypothetical protein SAMN05192559_1044 [Halobacillus karajensis]
MMIKIGEFIMIRELFQKGWSITAISKEMYLASEKCMKWQSKMHATRHLDFH